MSHTPHDLVADFPESAEQLHKLKLNNAHFQKLADQYHQVNRDVHRAETNIEPTSDAQLITLRKRRMVLKDEIYSILKSASVD